VLDPRRGIRDTFDHALIAGEIARHCGRRPAQIEGRSTKLPRYVYEATFDDDARVIFKGEHEPGDEAAIVLECWAMDRARNAGVPVSRVVALDTTCARFPGRYAIFERAPGMAMEDRDVSPDEAIAVYREAGAALRRLHTIEVEGWGHMVDEAYVRDGSTRGQRAHWREVALDPALRALEYAEQHAVVGARDIATMRRILQAHASQFTDDVPSRLLHGDFDRSHIYIEGTPPRLTSIIDFGDRSAGDPAYDIAGVALWDGVASMRAALEGYCEDAGDREATERRALVYLLAQRLRLMHRRYETGRMPHADDVRDQAVELVHTERLGR
jgi:Ser/Thr protein kinase RdoA (MazF antagonist)